jgi:hypothetical protein
MAELRARYSGRGVSVNARNTAKAQIAGEQRDAIAENTRISYDRISGISNEYRSGEYKGSKYMTSDDFVRYFRNRDTYNMPLALREVKITSESRVTPETRAVSTSRGRSSRTGSVVKSDSTSKEGNLINKVQSFVKNWFPIEPREGREVGTRFRFPARAVCSMAAFALSLMLIVSGSVMVGNASGELGMLNNDISKLETKQSELQCELDMKYNIQDIEKEATELGMIKNEYADKEYLKVAQEEKIEIFEEEEKEFGFAALLSAFGIDID